jgi:excisionase family DNA binding protein
MTDTIDSEECAALLRCTPEQVEELARAGDIPGLKIGRGWLFVRTDLLDYLAQKAREEAAERRSKRAVQSVVPSPIKQRRQVPPPLPVVPWSKP